MFRIKVPKSQPREHYHNIEGKIRHRIKVLLNPETEAEKEEAGKIQVSVNVFSDSDINGYLKELLTELYDSTQSAEPEVDSLWKLICSEPKGLFSIYEKKWKKLFNGDDKEVKNLKSLLEYIFDYDNFVGDAKHGAYALTKSLGIRICPYCNRSYVYTVIKKNGQNIVRPELDHYFPKSEYPMLALSFYNLIPSCHICNSNIKGKKELRIGYNYHPYISDDIEMKFRLSFDKIEDAQDSDEKLQVYIRLLGNDKVARDTAEFFELPTIYKEHFEEAEHLLKLYQNYPKEFIEVLLDFFRQNGVSMSKERILNIIYDHFLVDNPDDEILGNMKSDLYRWISDMYN